MPQSTGSAFALQLQVSSAQWAAAAWVERGSCHGSSIWFLKDPIFITFFFSKPAGEERQALPNLQALRAGLVSW